MSATSPSTHEPLTTKDRAATYDNRGVMLDLLGKTEKAAAISTRPWRWIPTLGDPYVNLGSMLIKQKRYDEALDQYQQGHRAGHELSPYRLLRPRRRRIR